VVATVCAAMVMVQLVESNDEHKSITHIGVGVGTILEPVMASGKGNPSIPL
jgi:hypothetical protein